MARVSEIATSKLGQGASNSVFTQQFSVPFRYPVYFTEALFSPDNPVFVQGIGRLEPERRHRCVVFLDNGVATAQPAILSEIETYFHSRRSELELVTPPKVIPGGEAVKNDLALVERLQRLMQELGIDRHSNVVAIGGGAVLDLIGYVAATTHRGVRMVRVPTTVLAQNDSGVGVKTGVNAFDSKNYLGVFAPPFVVFNDFDFLRTLSERDRRSGMAEAIKVALIRDAGFFGWLEANVNALRAYEDDTVAHLVRRCAELHMHQIAYGGDPFEQGSARPLDFGHWAAHKLESLTRHEVRHGEAVAIGMALDARYSVLTGLLAESDGGRVCHLLEGLGFRLWHDALDALTPDGNHAVLAGLREFQEHLGGELTVTLLTSLGVGEEVNVMDRATVLASLSWLKRRDAMRSSLS